MDLYTVLDQVMALLRTRQRVSYRALTLQFQLDDDALEALKEEVLFAHPQVVEEQGRGLVWTGALEPAPSVPSASPSAPHVSAQGPSPLAYTPQHLADQILTSRHALEGERKQVTVLFADVAGFSTMAAPLDPETVHTIMDGCFAILTAQVHGHEGTINQFTGDGIMALFGAPITHEDHAVRACYAALGIQAALRDYSAAVQQQWSVPFQMRLGLNTGLVVVGRIGDDLRMDYTAQGDTTNVAARMQQIAPPGAIWVAEATFRIAAEAFVWKAVGPMTVKGRASPVAVYELDDHRVSHGRFDMVVRRGLTPFVGRESALVPLRAAWAHAQQGHGRVVSVVGTAGVGKSRLMYEFKQQVAQEEARCIEGACFTYGVNISYLPFLEIVQTCCGLTEGITEGAAKRQLAHRLATLGVDQAMVAPYLHHLLSLTVEDEVFPKLTPELIRQRTVEALTTFVVAEARQQPVVLILEDVHWIDQATEAVAEALVEAIAEIPLLLVLVYRPEYVQDWASRVSHAQITLGGLARTGGAAMVRAVLTKPYASQVPLESLSSTHSTTMVHDLLGTSTIPQDVEQLIITKTQGNPLFIEELTRSLLESGILVYEGAEYRLTQSAEALELPTTVQGVLLARVDRLREDRKEVLQVAAVIGRMFSYPVLARVVQGEAALEPVLLELEELEFLYPTSLAPQREYSFKHVLTQQAVYDALLMAKRQALHERIGAATEFVYPDRLDEHCELLAYHYGRSANTEKAFVYLDQANRKAIRTNAMQEAKVYFDDAMRLLDLMPDTVVNRSRRITLLAHQGPVMLLLFKFAECYALLKQYEPIALALGDAELLGAFHGCLGHCQWFFGEYTQAIATLDKASHLSEVAGNSEAAGYAYMLLAWTYMCQGNFARVRALRDLAMHQLGQKFNLRNHTWALAAASLACTFQGHWDSASDDSVRAMRAAEALFDNSNISFAAMMLSINHTFKGDLRAALNYGEHAVDKSVTPADKAWAAGFYGVALCRAGEPRQAIALLEDAVNVQRAGGFIAGEFFTLCLGEAYWRAGALDRAQATLAEALATFERCGMQFFRGSAHRLLAEVALQSTSHPREAGDAADHLATSVAILESMHADNELALAYTAYGRLHQQEGHIPQARDYLVRALAIFERLGTMGEPDQVRRMLEALS